MALKKPFEAPQRSVKMKIFISIQLLEMPGTGSINREELRDLIQGRKTLFFTLTEKSYDLVIIR